MLEREKYFKIRKNLEQTIRPGDVVVTRGGENVRIYAVEGEIVHGAVFHNNRWEIDTWNIEGNYLIGKGKKHERDLTITKPLQLLPNKKYKSRDGRPVKIYDINRDSSEFPVIGAIKDEAGNWLPRIWNEKGITKVPYGPNNDIIEVWSET